MPLSFTAYFWRGTRESWASVIFELRPVAWQSAVSAGKPRGHTPPALPAPTAQSPGPGAPLAHCMCCLLGGHWTHEIWARRVLA